MKKNILIITSIFIGILAVAIFLFVSNEKSKEERATSNISEEQLLLKNTELPNAKILTDNGEEKSITDFKNDKPTFLMYWASWCPDCRKQLPDVEKLYKEYKDRVNFVLVNVMDGERETIEQAKAYIKENNYTFTYYRSTDEAVEKFKIKTIPTKFIADKNGKINEIHSEKHTSYDTLKNELEKNL